MAIVQIVLPKLVGLVFVLMLVDVAQAHPTAVWNVWPHHWPVAAQAALMLLTADFFRYWLHRWAHTIPLLWRFHAVHHSPARLYWLNVGRFHPVDKTLQLLLDTLPFVLLGVGEAVIAFYFVFYAVNGFFQHSNINLRFGVLNYLISSAELHRWHHSRRIEESNTNYGNNVILWDLLFGTRFLPKERSVGELGLINRRYPAGFWSQMAAPFTPDLPYRDVPIQGARRVIGRWLFWIAMQWVKVTAWRSLRSAARRPKQVQWRVLKTILAANRDTRFGREHDFARIQSYEDFAQQVPIQDYESLRPYIDEQEATRTPALTREHPGMYAVTSGTTGQPKYLPVLSQTLRDYRQEQRLLAYVLFHAVPMAFTGKVFGIASAAVEGHRPSGVPYGSVSGRLYQTIPALMRMNNVVPPPVYEIKDADTKYRIMLRLALAEPEMTHMLGANASSFLRLLALLNVSRDLFAESLESGDISVLGVPLDLQVTINRYLRPCSQRARVLRTAPRDRDLTFADLWPEIRLVTVWTGGSCGVAVNALRQTLPAKTKIIELGYLASELRGTITVDPAAGAGVPTFQYHFFEFVQRDDWEAGRKHCLRLDELEEGKDYYVIVTTPAGLYRYFMNDIVRVVGRFGATPTIVFVQKGRGVTSITGEKLYESQLLHAVHETAEKHGFTPVFVMGLADEERNVYRLYIEPAVLARAPDATQLAGEIDRRLAELNIEYEAKRSSGRLAPLELYWLQPGAGEAYKAHAVKKGQREGQFKTIALQLSRQVDFDLDDCVLEL